MIPLLPVFSIVYRAYAIVWENLRTLIRAALLPGLVLVVLQVVEDAVAPGRMLGLVFWLAGLPFAALIAVACHRVFLLGPASLDNPWSLFWSDRESSFLTWLVILGVATYLLSLVLGIFMLMAPNRWLGVALFLFALIYLQGRFSMVLPATAVGERMFLSGSWYLTSGNGLRYAVALAIPVAFAIIIMLLLISLAGFLPTPVFTIVITAWFVFTGAVEIAVLSLSYKFLTESDLESGPW